MALLICMASLQIHSKEEFNRCLIPSIQVLGAWKREVSSGTQEQEPQEDEMATLSKRQNKRNTNVNNTTEPRYRKRARFHDIRTMLVPAATLEPEPSPTPEHEIAPNVEPLPLGSECVSGGPPIEGPRDQVSHSSNVDASPNPEDGVAPPVEPRLRVPQCVSAGPPVEGSHDRVSHSSNDVSSANPEDGGAPSVEPRLRGPEPLPLGSKCVSVGPPSEDGGAPSVEPRLRVSQCVSAGPPVEGSHDQVSHSSNDVSSLQVCQ